MSNHLVFSVLQCICMIRPLVETPNNCTENIEFNICLPLFCFLHGLPFNFLPVVEKLHLYTFSIYKIAALSSKGKNIKLKLGFHIIYTVTINQKNDLNNHTNESMFSVSPTISNIITILPQ